MAFTFATTPHVRPVGAVVADLSREAGRPMAVERALRGVPVLIDESGASPGRRLEDLAFALHASLARDGATLWLVRSATDRETLRALHQAWLRGRIEAGLFDREARLRRSAALGDEATQLRAAQETVGRARQAIAEAEAAGRPATVPPGLINPPWLNPAGRLVVALARRIGAAALADIPPNGVRYFSDRPNAAESPLPRCDDLLAEYDRRVGEEDGGKGPPHAKVVLRASEFGVGVRLFDARGRQTDIGVTNYANQVIFGLDALPWGGKEAAWRPLDLASRTMASFLGEDRARRVAGLQQGDAARGFVVPPVPTFPEPYLHPELQDPLDFVVREGVLALAPKGGGTVAVLADWMLPLANARVREGRLDVEGFARALAGEGLDGRAAVERVAHGGTTVLRPGDELGAEAAQADRTSLGEVVRRIVADRAITLFNWPAAYWTLYPSRFSPVRGAYLEALVDAGLRHTSDVGNIDAGTLALLGAALRSGEASVDASRPPYREILRDEIAQDGAFRLSDASGTSDLDRAPSSLLGSGILDRARVLLATSEAPLMDRGGDGTGAFYGVDPSRLEPIPLYTLSRMARSEAKTRELFTEKYLKHHYRLGHLLTLSAEIQLGSLRSRVELQDSVLDRTGLTFDQLPKDCQADVLEAVRRGLEREGTPVPSFLLRRG